MLYSIPMPAGIHCFQIFLQNILSDHTSYNLLQVIRSKMGCILFQIFLKNGSRIYDKVQQMSINPQMYFPPHIQPKEDYKQWKHIFNQIFNHLQQNNIFLKILENLPKMDYKVNKVSTTNSAAAQHNDAGNAPGANDAGKPIMVYRVNPNITLVQYIWELYSSFIEHLDLNQNSIFQKILKKSFINEIQWRKQGQIQYKKKFDLRVEEIKKRFNEKYQSKSTNSTY